MDNLLSRIPWRYWAYLTLSMWGVAVYFLLRKSAYGVDEGAARGLLLTWSVVDRVVTPVVALGVPDFRAIYFVPVAILWTGNILAARIFTVIFMAVVALSIYKWRLRNGDAESALLATGLLLISPSIIDQFDMLGVAPYLLSCFVFGSWLDRFYREEPRAFSGLYFSQIFLCLVSTTLHPAGLAYPVALTWSWYKQPLNKERSKSFIIGITIAALIALLLTSGWHPVGWLTNPVRSLSDLVLGPSPIEGDLVGIRGAVGSGVLGVLLLVVWQQRFNLWNDLLGRALLIGLIAGLPVADEAWSVLALMVCLYWGFPLLLKVRVDISGGFLSQRGVALTLLFVISTTFMFTDKIRYQQLQRGFLSPRDELIQTLVEDNNFLKQRDRSDGNKQIRIASQWPGRTMLACRCDTLPLPPSVKDEQTLLKMLHGISYLIFDPQDTDNQSLVRNLALLGGEKAETIAVKNSGVIVQMRGASPQNDAPAIP